MTPIKPGDIVKQQVAGGRWDFFHVEAVHGCGAVDAIDDHTGKPCGLSAHHSRIEPACMQELLAERARREGV